MPPLLYALHKAPFEQCHIRCSKYTVTGVNDAGIVSKKISTVLYFHGSLDIQFARRWKGKFKMLRNNRAGFILQTHHNPQIHRKTFPNEIHRSCKEGPG
jgi:hypothetical protein